MMKLYVDMDGTLVDFVTHITEHDFWRKDKPDKVDWDKVIAEGPAFWSKMNWFPGAENAFARLMELDEKGKLDLFILSSIDFEEGIEGKRQWIQKKTAFPLDKAIFVTEPEDKARYAAPDSWLIDDRKKSLEPFVAAGGNIIEFTGDWESVLGKIQNEAVFTLENKSVDDIAFMKYSFSTSDFSEMLKTGNGETEKFNIYFYPDGRIVKRTELEKGRVVNTTVEHIIPVEKIHHIFTSIMSLLSSGNLSKKFYHDDSHGELILFFSDGSNKTYDRGTSNGTTDLLQYINEFAGQ